MLELHRRIEQAIQILKTEPWNQVDPEQHHSFGDHNLGRAIWNEPHNGYEKVLSAIFQHKNPGFISKDPAEAIRKLRTLEITDELLVELYSAQWREIFALLEFSLRLKGDDLELESAHNRGWPKLHAGLDDRSNKLDVENRVVDLLSSRWNPADGAYSWVPNAASVAKALATRDLIGSSDIYTQTRYDRLTATWRYVFGAVHSSDLGTAHEVTTLEVGNFEKLLKGSTIALVKNAEFHKGDLVNFIELWSDGRNAVRNVLVRVVDAQRGLVEGLSEGYQVLVVDSTWGAQQPSATDQVEIDRYAGMIDRDFVWRYQEVIPYRPSAP